MARVAAVQAAAEIAVLEELPNWPGDCRVMLAHGAVAGERPEQAFLRAAARLGAQNERLARCGAWYDGLRAEVSPDADGR